MKKTVALILLLALAASLCLVNTGFAGTSTESGGSSYSSSSLQQRINDLPPFKFNIHKYGIGYGSCPVYTAPSLDAYRCANGKATCQTNSKMDDGGFVDNGWLLVRYETNNGQYRVGYIPHKYVRDFKSQMYPHFGYIEVTADDRIMVTDNPMSHTGGFAYLDPDETFHIISRYNYYAKNGFDWLYIECWVDGKVARGFIENDLSKFH